MLPNSAKLSMVEWGWSGVEHLVCENSLLLWSGWLGVQIKTNLHSSKKFILDEFTCKVLKTIAGCSKLSVTISHYYYSFYAYQ